MAMQVVGNVDWDHFMLIVDRLDFFSRFSKIERRRLLGSHSDIVSCDDGEAIVGSDSDDRSLYVILSGSVGVFVVGNRNPVATLESGDFFGEVSFVTNEARIATVKANEPLFLLRIDEHMFASLTPEIRERVKDKIIEKLVKRLNHMNELFGTVSSSVSDVMTRMAAVTRA